MLFLREITASNVPYILVKPYLKRQSIVWITNPFIHRLDLIVYTHPTFVAKIPYIAPRNILLSTINKPMSISTPIPSNFPTRLRVVYPQQVFNYKDSMPLRSDCIWKIEQGVVRSLTWNEEGNAITLGFWGKGDVVGQPLSRLEPYQVVCLTSVTASQLPLENYSLQPALLIHEEEKQRTVEYSPSTLYL